MTILNKFAAFVRQNKLEEFINADLNLLRSIELPVLRYLKATEEDLKDLLRKNLHGFLYGLETNTSIEIAKVGLNNWQEDKLPGISKGKISLADLVLAFYTQKASLIQLIPSFTSDIHEAINITQELENYYLQVQSMAVEVLQKIEEEARQLSIENEEKYRDLFDNATDLIHFASPSGTIL